MIKRYFLPLLQGACFLLLSLILQNCGGSYNIPNEEEATQTLTIEKGGQGTRTRIGAEEEESTETIEQEGEQGRRKRARIETEEYQEERNIIPAIMPELWQIIFSHLDFEGVLAAREVSPNWNELITGYRQPGIVGVENKSLYIINTSNWTKNKAVNFQNSKLKKLTPATIPSFAFYHLMGHVKNIPQRFWPYLSGTKVDMVDLYGNQIGDLGTIEFAKHLQGTQVHTIDLGDNSISDQGVKGFAKHLAGTRVHTVNLSRNRISDQGAEGFAKHLQGTLVHTVNLSLNQIGDQGRGVVEFAKHLQGTRVHTVYLSLNEIGDQGAEGFAKYLQGTQVHTIDLSNNEIGDQGAEGFAKYLQGTQVHTIDLSDNEIGTDIQSLLIEQYPHIKWVF
jgi:hypothetical protein